MSARRLVPFLAALALSASCADTRTPAGNEEPDPLKNVAISVTGQRVIFDGKATELMLTVDNQRKEALALVELGSKTRLLLADGRALSLHRYSLGVAKPLRVKAGKSVDTSLLFDGAGAAPIELKISKAQFSVPAQRGSTP